MGFSGWTIGSHQRSGWRRALHSRSHHLLSKPCCLACHIFVLLGVLNHDFDRGLGRYPREQFDTWYQLSCHISKSTLARLEPVDHVLFSSTLKHEDSDDPERTSTVFYTDINERFLPKDALPSEVTAINLDKTPILEHLIEKDFNGGKHFIQLTMYLFVLIKLFLEPAELLGEMQFAFISFLLGQTYEGFEHWKRIVSLLCSCERGLTDFRKFFSNFIGIILYSGSILCVRVSTDTISRILFLSSRCIANSNRAGAWRFFRCRTLQRKFPKPLSIGLYNNSFSHLS